MVNWTKTYAFHGLALKSQVWPVANYYVLDLITDLVIRSFCCQGRLEPVQTHVKNNKRGVGADKGKKKILRPTDQSGEEQKNGNVSFMHHILEYNDDQETLKDTSLLY